MTDRPLATVVDEAAFAERRRVALKTLGRIASSSAKGLLIDLDYHLEQVGGLDLKARWRGDDDCGFTVVGRFQGDANDAVQRILAALADVGYAQGHDAARVSSSADRVRVWFLTMAPPNIGVAIVCIDVTAATG